MDTNNPLIPPWAEVPPEIWILIISYLCIRDRFVCRLVCRAWPAMERQLPPPHQLPWLMLSLRPDSTSGSFLSLTDTTIIQMKLPEEPKEAMCCGSIDGWLVFNYNSDMTCLFNPLSKSHFVLPPGLSCPSIIHSERRNSNTPYFLRKIIFSSPPDTPSNHCQVAAIYDSGVLFHGWKIMNDLAVGDDFIIDNILFDQTPLQTTLWAISIHEKVCMNVLRKRGAFEYDYSRFKKLRVEERVRQEFDLVFNKHVYLVQFCGSGKLVMVLRYYEGEGSVESTITFKVYELVLNPNEPDFMDYYAVDGNWVEMNDLEGHAIFLSCNCSRAILASNYDGLEEDKIYFADEIRDLNGITRDRFECGDVGVFSLKDESITWLVENKVNSSDSPPAWFFHLNVW